MEQEVWKDIPGFECRYQASTLGRVRSLDRVILKTHPKTGTLFAVTWKGRILKGAGSKYNPHLYVVLGRNRDSRKNQNGSPIHQLVALTFLGPPPVGQEVRHLNGNPLDNRLVNLCYGTRRDNILDVLRIGKPWRKLTRAQAEEIRTRRAAGERGSDLAREFGISQSIVSAIYRGKVHNAPLGL